MTTGLFLASWVIVVLKCALPIPALDATSWPEAALVLAATAATLSSLARQLPAQNVLLASCIIGASDGAVHIINALTGIPFGPCAYTAAAGAKLFGVLPWPLPLIWIVFILSSRGVSHLILRPWRQTHYYGFWVIGLTVFLALLLATGWELFGLKVERLWIREPSRFGWEWYGTPLIAGLAWVVTALLILVVAAPSLIRKNPTPAPPGYQPLVIWLAINALFASAAAAHQFWMEASGIALIAGATALFAIRGARR